MARLSSDGRAFLGSRTDLTTRGFASSLVTRASSAAFDSFFLGTIGDPERYTRFLVRFFSISSEAKYFLSACGSTRRPPADNTHGFPAAT